MVRTPLRCSTSDSQYASLPIPIGLTTPKPVTTISGRSSAEVVASGGVDITKGHKVGGDKPPSLSLAGALYKVRLR